MFNAENKLEEILNWLEEYRIKTNCKGVALGLSGGKDSTTVAMLAKKVWGENVIAVLMPNGEQKDISDSIEIAETLQLNYKIVNIKDAYDSLIDNIEVRATLYEEGFKLEHNCGQVSEKAKTNIAPRIRMTTLYAIAQTYGYRVIGTGNASEIYVGWFTKFGDGGCDINPLKYLTKTEVVEVGKLLAKEFGLEEEFITKTPADGLTGKSDEDNLGFTYEILDSHIRGLDVTENKEVIEKIEKMHKISKHKTVMPLGPEDDIYNIL